MSRRATASKTKPQGKIDRMNLSDDECVQKLAALIEHRDSRNPRRDRKVNWPPRCARGVSSAAEPCGGSDRPAPDSPQIPDSPAAFLESCRGPNAAMSTF